MSERKALIGEEGLLFSDEELRERIGVPENFLQQLEPQRVTSQ